MEIWSEGPIFSGDQTYRDSPAGLVCELSGIDVSYLTWLDVPESSRDGTTVIAGELMPSQ